MRFSPLILLPFLCATFAIAAEPELSSDQPITYEADKSLLIAEGNAVYSDGSVRVVADVIRFHRDRGLIEAEGNVSLTRDGMRLVSDWISYETKTKQFKSGPYRAGYPPFFMEGDGFSGTPEEIDFSRLTVFIREPVKSAPKLSLNSATWIPNESFSANGIDLQFPFFGKIPLPKLTYDGNTEAIRASGEMGYRKSLGLYGRSEFLYPFFPNLSLGGNFDFYTERGVLVGPALSYQHKTDNSNLRVKLNTGWIRDHNVVERGTDSLGNPIDRERGFVEAELRYRNSNTIQFNSGLFYLSDSEVLRDFRPDRYFRQYNPDAFAEFTYINDTFALNVFTRAQINDYYGLVERLPQVRLEGLPQTLGDTRLITQWSVEFANLRKATTFTPTPSTVGQPFGSIFLPEDFATLFSEIETSDTIQRIDADIRLSYPIIQQGALSVSGIAGAKWTHYSDSLVNDSIDRWVGEAGLNADYTLARVWNINSPTWNIKSVRHVLNPTAKYRRFINGDDYRNSIPAIDTYIYNPTKPVIDLFDLRHVDQLTNLNLLRVGIENRFESKDLKGNIRELAAFNLYEDIIFSDEGTPQEAFYIEASLSPIEWLRLDWEQKIRAESLETEATFFRAAINSADLWEIALVAEYLEGSIEQYGIDAAYRITEKNMISTSIRYDSRIDSVSRQQYGLRRRIANVWEVEFYVAFNEQNQRDDSTSFGVSLRLLNF